MELEKISLFTGIGGDDIASEWAGIKTTCFVEKDKYCRKVLSKHWPNTPIHDDIKTFTKTRYRELTGRNTVDIISGGFPCQPFSNAGKRLGKDDDRFLWPEMRRVVSEFHPPWVVAENVYGFVSVQQGDILDQVYLDLEAEGYETLPPIVYPACGFNAPHKRNRVFIVAHYDNQRFTRSSVSIGKGKENENTGRGDKILSYSNGKRFQEQWQSGEPEKGTRWKESKCRSWWESEPELGRVANGIPNRVDRLKGLGNAVVPIQIFIIYRIIAELSERWLQPKKQY